MEQLELQMPLLWDDTKTEWIDARPAKLEMVKPITWTRPLLYVSGPMVSEGNPYENIYRAVMAAMKAYEKGWSPHIPHLDCLISMITGKSDIKMFYDMDRSQIKASVAILVLPYTVEESGTGMEVSFAEDCGKPIYTEETLPYVN